jgi:hypothetical protein
MTEPRWINDHCDGSWIWPMDRARANGILKIHRTCTPPCPRVQAAAQYLAEQEAPTT